MPKFLSYISQSQTILLASLELISDFFSDPEQPDNGWESHSADGDCPARIGPTLGHEGHLRPRGPLLRRPPLPRTIKPSLLSGIRSGLVTNPILILFPFCEKSLICLEGKSMTPHRGNTFRFRSSQQLLCLCLGPSKGFLS